MLSKKRKEGKSVGFVPTMGALHAGHASLVRRSVEENHVTVASVFVNPTQFNDKKDLENYPRDLEADTRLLESLGVDVAFVPEVGEMYPGPDNRVFSYPPVDTVMEGRYRPGHFNGVCQIVSKLLYAVMPDRVYFGEKDFQQIAVVKAMVNALQLPVEIRPCEIVRETGGLALSSRNSLLSEAERRVAAAISKTLAESRRFAETHSVGETRDFVVGEINSVGGLEVQYFEIVDGDSLLAVSDWNESDYVVGCITVFCGQRPVRLIDNVKYKEKK